jgi:hypothetical protein
MFVLPASPASPAVPAVQVPPTAPDPIEVSRFFNNPKDEIQLAAIADELNLFLVEPIVGRRRVAGVIEVRNAISAERIFASGPPAIANKPVPLEVLTALRATFRDDNPRVGLEALYAFGVLGIQPSGADRQTLLAASAPELAAFLGSADVAMRLAAVRVIGRLFSPRLADAPLDATLGDAVVHSLNDPDEEVRLAAMQALGRLREVRAVQGLAQLFEYHGRSREGDAALDALARIAHPSSAPIFSAALNGDSTPQRITAIEGLARLGDASALPAIEAAAARDRSDTVALAAAFANARLAHTGTAAISEALARPKLHDQAQGYLNELGSASR